MIIGKLKEIINKIIISKRSFLSDQKLFNFVLRISFDDKCGCNFVATDKTNKTAHSNKINSSRISPRANVRLMIEVLAKDVQRTSISINRNTHCVLWWLPLMLIMCLANATAAPPTTIRPQSTTTSILPSTVIVSQVAAVTVKSMASIADSPLMVANTSYNKRLRKRHSKRHSDWFDYNNFNVNSTNLEWVNPCGGYYMPTNAPAGDAPWRKQLPNKIYNVLKKSANNELNTLRGSQQDINITNIQIWLLHDYAYKFLPKLKINSTIALKRWYRNMQTYVGSFAYLRRVQLKWDHAKSQRESAVARELKHLLISSRAMLCELETAVNGTRPQKNNKKYEHVSRTQMEKRLKLRSKRRIEQHPNDVQEADPIDLKFVKYYYYEFLDTMWKVLRRVTKRKQANNKRNLKPEINFNEVDKLSTITSTTRKSRIATTGGRRSQRRPVGRLSNKKNKIKNNRNNKHMSRRI